MPQIPVVICNEHHRRSKHHRVEGAAPTFPFPYQVQINFVRAACGLEPFDFQAALPGQASHVESRKRATATGDCSALACVMLEHPGRRVEGRLSLQNIDEQIAFQAAGCPSDAAIFSISRTFAFLDDHDWVETATSGPHRLFTVTALSRTSAHALLQQRGRSIEVDSAANDPGATPIVDDDMMLQDLSDGEAQ